MRWKRFLILTICFVFFLFVASCSHNATNDTYTSSLNNDTSDNSSSFDRLTILETQNKELINENESLKQKVNELEDRIESASNSPLMSNYHIDELLQKIYSEKSQVDIFPGVLQSIKIQEIAGTMYFIFSIDKMVVNPDWNGEGSAGGKGYYINTEVKYQEYKGELGTVFANIEYKGYESYKEKQDAILSDYNAQDIYNFYMIGDEIVFIGPDPGP